MVYNVLSNNFEDFLNDIYIGTKIKRLYFGDNDELIITNETIYPIICKKYNILFPHDYNNIDIEYINKVKNKYQRRISRYINILNNDCIDKNIYLVYFNETFNLNEWQKSVYNEYDTKILENYTNSDECYLTKIKDLYKDRTNVNVISLDELKVMQLN